MGYKFVDERISLDPVTGEMVTPEEFLRRQESRGNSVPPSRINKDWESREPAVPMAARAVHIVKDIEPYRSVMTGEVIGSRNKHREHLRRHDVIEVGNERLPPRKPARLPDPRRDLARAFAERNS